MTNYKGRGNRNLQEILSYHLQTKRFIGGLCKLEKDGTMTKINGQIFAIRTTKNGDCIAIIDNLLGHKRSHTKKRWQAVLTKNLVQINEHGWEHKKVA